MPEDDDADERYRDAAETTPLIQAAMITGKRAQGKS
jgi:hypothetical protein